MPDCTVGEKTYWTAKCEESRGMHPIAATPMKTMGSREIAAKEQKKAVDDGDTFFSWPLKPMANCSALRNFPAYKHYPPFGALPKEKNMATLTHALLALSIIQLAAAPLANAQVSARASLSNVGIRLTDLAPDDGIAPSYTYSQIFPDYQQATTSISYGPRREKPSGSMSDTGLMPWANHHLDFDSTALPDHQGAHLAGATRRSGTSLETLDLSVVSSAQGTGSNWVGSSISSWPVGN